MIFVTIILPNFLMPDFFPWTEHSLVCTKTQVVSVDFLVVGLGNTALRSDSSSGPDNFRKSSPSSPSALDGPFRMPEGIQ